MTSVHDLTILKKSIFPGWPDTHNTNAGPLAQSRKCFLLYNILKIISFKRGLVAH